MKKLIIFILLILSNNAFSQNTCEGSYTFLDQVCTKIIIGDGTSGSIKVCLKLNQIPTSGGGNNCNPGGVCNPPFNGGGWPPSVVIYASDGTDYTGALLSSFNSSTAIETCFTVSTTNGYAAIFGICSLQGTVIEWNTVNSCGLNICSGSQDCIAYENDYISNALILDACGVDFRSSNSTATNDYDSGVPGCGTTFANLDCNVTTSHFGSAGNDVSWSIENDIWYKFCPDITGDWEVTVTGSNCSNSGGYQMAIFQGTPDNLVVNHYTSTCTQTQGMSCVRSLTGTTTVNINVTDISNCVYLVIDGHAGAVCIFDVSIETDVCDLQVTLPIVLKSFYAISNHILWETLSEINNDYFTLERSKTGTIWNEIFRVNGKNFSQTLTVYEYYDYNQYQGTNYYRLTQYDNDGMYEVFKIIKIINNEEIEEIEYILDVFGKVIEDPDNYNGIKIIIYKSGKIVKTF